MGYEFKPWKKYKVADNGLYAPKGSNPTFHTELNVFIEGINPLHPFVEGYIMHDKMKGEEIVRKVRLFANLIYDN
jgi:hypothetical protein